MNKWKFLVTAAMTLGLVAGMAFSAFARTQTFSDGEVGVGAWVDGKDQGPLRVTFIFVTAVWQFC